MKSKQRNERAMGRWPRRRSRFRRKRSPLRPRAAMLPGGHPHPQRRRHHPRPTIPGRHDNFGCGWSRRTSHRKTVLASRMEGFPLHSTLCARTERKLRCC